MLYARKDIPSTCLGVETSLAKVFYTETNLQKKKWLLCCSYNPSQKSNIQSLLVNIKSLALYLSKL